ncbi:DUF2207 domain-containing protein [Pseudomonas sp. ML96]|uniref:DUF2207 domain-containing protein n=1 Tax=Pseudomonas sp. ML96 TaxID=1523503 RepID=UPI0005BD9EF8|nr:DUF2207 domain-containing protein [Pseudomonas sp. ML96]
MPGWLRILSLLCCLLPGVSQAQERIEDFAVQLRVTGDGMLEVIEKITVHAEGEQIQRGIYRDIPVTYSLPGGLLRKTPIALLGATRDGAPESVREERIGAYQRFYLGSPAHYLQPGRYVYRLHYRVDPQLLHRADEDELYWNVTGNAWAFPILQASVRLQLPAGARIGSVYGYTGASGEQGAGYREVERGADYLRLETTEVLAPQQGFTLAVGWPAGLVERPSLLWRGLRLLWDNAGVALGGLLWLALLGYYVRTWRRVGRDPRKGLHIVRFEAPDDLSPVQVGYLWHKGFRGGFDEARALGVCFTDWAIRGLIRLEDLPHGGGFSVQRGDKPIEEGRVGEIEWLRRMFPASKADAPLELGGRYQPRLAEMKTRMVDSLATHGRLWHANNRSAWATGLAIAVPGLLLSVLTGLQGEEQWGLAIGGLMFSLGFGVPTAVVLGLALRESGYGKRLVLWLVALMFGFPVPIGLWMLLYACSLPVMLLVIAYLLVVALFYRWLEAPSAKGQELLDAAAGYRDYLQLAEGEVLERAGGSPVMTIALYERHLAYAMALGVEEKWSARFAAALQSGLIDAEQYQPDWYRARGSLSSPSSFGTVLSSSLVSASASASTPPASSSSGGGGSSGGGSSGGGSGGGGGGGW